MTHTQMEYFRINKKVQTFLIKIYQPCTVNEFSIICHKNSVWSGGKRATSTETWKTIFKKK